MAEGGIANNMNDILETGYCQSYHLIKDNMENKQIDKIEKLSETKNYNNPAIRPYRKRHSYNIYLYQKNNIPNRKILFESQYKPV